MQNNLVLTTPQELQTLITDAVNVAVRQISLPQKIDSLPEFLTIQEAAAFLNLAVPTLYSMVNRGDISYIKKAKKLYFLRENLSMFLLSGQRETKKSIIKKSLKLKKNNEITQI
ncbi:helix-turn-helix domain-containing protein [Emticicia sp. SJ17W-69]|uniref:helix-turn-helix domain-containing protein n=1 Tax=Emticicia sp. SJ17W-69 TaxID=3421657 RepID=UPI003EB854C5